MRSSRVYHETIIVFIILISFQMYCILILGVIQANCTIEKDDSQSLGHLIDQYHMKALPGFGIDIVIVYLLVTF